MFRFWHYSLRIGVPVLFGLVIAKFLFRGNETVTGIGGVATVLLVLLALGGGVLALLLIGTRFTLACPQCGSKQTRMGSSEAADFWIECPSCGTTEGRGFFKLGLRLNANSCNPTRAWGDFSGWDNPIVVPDELRVGEFAFGDRIEAFESLGRADGFEWAGLNFFHLDYRQAGVQLDFEDRQLVYVGFILHPSACGRELGEAHWSAASPQVQLAGGETKVLSRETSVANLIAMLGPPTRIDKDPQETILFYQDDRLIMEFELESQAQTLARWNLFPGKSFPGDESEKVAV